ncbi:MAG: antibiotic biosynthesis monooxygenase [Chitinophagaceae bacterium]
MFVRLTYFSLAPDITAETKKVYYNEIAPVIQKQPGIVEVMLLEPVNSDDEFISCTVWKSEADTKAFESSSIYNEVFGKIKAATIKSPYQKYYNVE